MPKKIKKVSPKPSKSAAKKTHSSPKKKTLKTPAKKPKEVKASKTSKAAKPAKAHKAPKEASAKKKVVKAPKVEAPAVHSKNGKSGAKEAAKPAPVPVKAVAPISVIDHPDVQEKLRELIKLAKEQGYLTFDDLNEALPDNVNDPDEMETIMGRLRTMEIEIIEAILSLARALGLEVVAEGVETREQLNQLDLLNCQHVQGYLFSKPVDDQAVTRLLVSSPYWKRDQEHTDRPSLIPANLAKLPSQSIIRRDSASTHVRAPLPPPLITLQ